jgi:cytochrome P450
MADHGKSCLLPGVSIADKFRICLGQQFALTEAGYVVVRLLQKFDKLDGSAMAGFKDDWYTTLTGRPMHGVKLRLHAAADE